MSHNFNKKNYRLADMSMSPDQVVPYPDPDETSEKQKRHYRARMAVASLFCSFLAQGDERARFMKRLDVEDMPVIIPALGNTLASNIRQAACRYLEAGENCVLVPVCLPVPNSKTLKLSVLVVSMHDDATTFWQLDMNKLHGNAEMAHVVEALDPSKKWEIEELDSLQQQELMDLVASV